MSCKNTDLDPQTLCHNFRFMGAAFDGKLNQNSRRNDDAMSGGLDLHSYLEKIDLTIPVCMND